MRRGWGEEERVCGSWDGVRGAWREQRASWGSEGEILSPCALSHGVKTGRRYEDRHVSSGPFLFLILKSCSPQLLLDCLFHFFGCFGSGRSSTSRETGTNGGGRRRRHADPFLGNPTPICAREKPFGNISHPLGSKRNGQKAVLLPLSWKSSG